MAISKPAPTKVSTKKTVNIRGDLRGLSPTSLANLDPHPHPWKPGESGHPQGESLKACLQRLSLKPLSPPKPSASAVERLAYVTLRDAIEGKPVQFTTSWERLEGRVVEKVELAGTLLNLNVPVAQLTAEDLRLLLADIRERRKALPMPKERDGEGPKG